MGIAFDSSHPTGSDVPFHAKRLLASHAGLKQDRSMASVPTPARMTAALRGRMPVAVPQSNSVVVNNNRNNASLPRAGD